MEEKKKKKKKLKVDPEISVALESNIDKIKKCKSTQELYDLVCVIFTKSAICSESSKEVLNVIKNSKPFTKTTELIWNIMLSGENLGLIED